jgi:hypothetical protein
MANHSFSNFTVYELTDGKGNRYGQFVSGPQAKIAADRQARLSNCDVHVQGLSNGGVERYVESIYYTATP